MRKNIKGFTLVEVLFAVTIGLLLLSAIFVAVQSGQRSSVTLGGKVSAQQDVRAALDLMAMEIAMASYNPTFTLGLWRTAVTGTNNCPIAANQTYRGIQTATATSIAVEMDKDESGSVTNDTNEVIIYTFYPDNQRIIRSTNCGPELDLLGCIDANGDGRCDNNSSLRNVRVINLALTYFDGQGSQILPANLPASIPNIRRIDISLTVATDAIDPNTNQRRTMIYSTSVIPRNHAM